MAFLVIGVEPLLSAHVVCPFWWQAIISRSPVCGTAPVTPVDRSMERAVPVVQLACLDPRTVVAIDSEESGQSITERHRERLKIGVERRDGRLDIGLIVDARLPGRPARQDLHVNRCTHPLVAEDLVPQIAELTQ